MCAQATCERTLAGIVSLRQLPGYGLEAPKGWEKWGLGKIIQHVREQGWVPADVLNDAKVLCETRKPYGHWRLPSDPGTIGRQTIDSLKHSSEDPAVPCRSASSLVKLTAQQTQRCACTSAITPKARSMTDFLFCYLLAIGG